MQEKLGHTAALDCLTALRFLSFDESRLVCRQGKLGHTSALDCLTALLFLPFDDSKLVCMQGDLGQMLYLPHGVTFSFLFHLHAFVQQCKLGRNCTLSCLTCFVDHPFVAHK